MSANILFISETTLKDRSLLQDNVDPKLIRPTIKQTQDMFIEPILGTGLYRELQDQIEDDTLTVLNKKLLDYYITDCISWYVASEMVLSLGFKMTNKNVLRKNSENSNEATLSELFDIMSNFKSKAEWYAQRITDYLCENIVDYPLYNNPGSGSDIIHPNNSSYSTGMFLGGKEKDYKDYSDMYQSQFGALGKDYRD